MLTIPVLLLLLVTTNTGISTSQYLRNNPRAYPFLQKFHIEPQMVKKMEEFVSNQTKGSRKIRLPLRETNEISGKIHDLFQHDAMLLRKINDVGLETAAYEYENMDVKKLFKVSPEYFLETEKKPSRNSH